MTVQQPLTTVNASRQRARRALVASGSALLFVAIALWPVIRAPVVPALPPLTIDDASQLNAVRVSEIIVPTTNEEIVDAVRRHSGPVSIGGARHSLGGQVASPGGVHIDMRRLNRILRFDPEARTITAEAGATWRQLQERIDPSNLSIEIMQSYANFTLGGSLSVNGHGRYVGRGPLIRSVKSLRIVLADGTLVDASPENHAELFYAAIGGYAAIGVIVDATIVLTDNVRVKRTTVLMPISKYAAFFRAHVRDQPAAVFHNANIFPDDYATVRAVTLSRTDDPVTNEQRLTPLKQSYRINRLAFWIQSEWPLGRWLQRHAIDPWFFAGEPVTWRNYEASRDVTELEPATRTSSTYLLQEFFVPIERFDVFAARMREVLETHGVNVVNVSVRHATQDPGSTLAWARTEVFAFVIYYKQAKDDASLLAARRWSRELIEAVLDCGGSYYLPYQIYATESQFRRAYPNADRFFALKARVDPTHKFRNQLLDAYGPWRRRPIEGRPD